MMSIPLTFDRRAEVLVNFDDTLVVGLETGDVKLDGVSKDKFFGTFKNDTAKAYWSSVDHKLTLRVAEGQDLDACVPYTVTFEVVNPFEVSSSPPTGAILQEAQPVTIKAVGSLGEMIGEGQMTVDISSAMSLPGTTLDDRAPLRVHVTKFFVKNIGQTSPYPAARNNLTVTISANSNLHRGSIIHIKELNEATAAIGDILLQGDDAVNFESLSGTNGHGTWNDCEKVLFLKVAADLGCTGNNFTVTFTIMNPLQPQVCAHVLINATKIQNAGVFINQGQMAEKNITQDNSLMIGDVSNGQPMEGDLETVPADIYGAMSGDACAMTVWPAAFIVKDIGQSNHCMCLSLSHSLSHSFSLSLSACVSLSVSGCLTLSPSLCFSLRVLACVCVLA